MFCCSRQPKFPRKYALNSSVLKWKPLFCTNCLWVRDNAWNNNPIQSLKKKKLAKWLQWFCSKAMKIILLCFTDFTTQYQYLPIVSWGEIKNKLGLNALEFPWWLSLPLNDIHSVSWLLRLNCLVVQFVTVV